MFGNFIYFIIVLLIYLTYQPSEETNFGAFSAFTFFFSLIIIFSYFTWIQFRRIEKKIATQSFSRLDNQFNSILIRQSILAILLFAIDIYGLNISSFLMGFPIFAWIPTLQALLFLMLFVFYLAIVWSCAYGPYQKLYRTDISRKSYVFSNISFSIPVLMPWLLLSGVSDIIRILPFDAPKQFLSTTAGEVSYFLFFLLAVAIMGPALIQKLWRCTPLEKGFYRERIERLCQRAGLAYADILYWPIFGGRMVTAGVMGLIKRFRYILVTPSLLSLLEPQEIDAVIAHEIGHIKRKHLLFYLAFFVGYMLLSYVAFDLIVYAIIYAEPVYWILEHSGLNQTTVFSGIFSIVIICVFLIYFRFVFGYYMRNFERQADVFVYTLFDSAGFLISTLEKIAVTSGQSPDRPNWHHFSISERIDYLKKCESNSIWITRHDNKVRKSIFAYIIGILVIGAIGYQLNFGAIGNRLNSHFFEKIILSELDKSPQNPNLNTMLGDFYYSRSEFAGAIGAYEKSLSVNPLNAKVLNNLAWLYATCVDPSFQNPQRALELAQKAIEIENSPYVWDTLAESYYINGLYPQAIEAGKRALALAKKNRSYYLEQLEKFKEALKS
jgi:Zn-dependent protease with chaperone function